MAARGQVFQDAQSQQQTQPYDSAPVEEITSDGHVDADEEVPATQQDSLVVVEPEAADPPTPATLVWCQTSSLKRLVPSLKVAPAWNPQAGRSFVT